MNQYDVTIIGAGLGGLECGFLLSKLGLNVLVLEKEPHVGGCLQTFQRAGHTFDTGFHYVGALAEGQTLNHIFRYFQLLDLPWQQLDTDCFDEVVVGERSFAFANGHDAFVETLAQHFPHQREALKQYVALLKQVGDNLPKSILNPGQDLGASLFACSAHKFLCETISDPLLRNVLSGTSLKMELKADTLPLYVFAQINNSFIQSAWRLRGGGQQLVDALANGIRRHGGEVRTQAEVTSLREAEGVISEIEINHDEKIVSKWVIGNLHPACLLALVEETKLLRRIYRQRINRLENTYGMFTANLRLHDNALPYVNSNIYWHNSNADLWQPHNNGEESLLISYQVPEKGDFATNIDLLTPMSWSEVEQWQSTKVGRRGDDYKQLKQQWLDKTLDMAEHRLPGLRQMVDKAYTSTPLTYNNYVNTAQGSAYGIRKDYANPLGTILAPQTPIPNLLLTGQSLNLHGVLGTSMTSLFTCAAIVGLEKVVDELKVHEW
ncbi:MAG: NAD(P)/FAD-dependent oxidoreductase [Bacteroidales bacterium]|nr:NAD(P)/FAD-dependent oxidoreductase [Bacteroidales bacterium]